MHRASYYREQAERARRMAKFASDDIYDTLMRLAQEFDDIAEDLENGAVQIRFPERMPQNRG